MKWQLMVRVERIWDIKVWDPWPLPGEISHKNWSNKIVVAKGNLQNMHIYSKRPDKLKTALISDQLQ